jgi:hypothetical protein
MQHSVRLDSADKIREKLEEVLKDKTVSREFIPFVFEGAGGEGAPIFVVMLLQSAVIQYTAQLPVSAKIAASMYLEDKMAPMLRALIDDDASYKEAREFLD